LALARLVFTLTAALLAAALLLVAIVWIVSHGTCPPFMLRRNASAMGPFLNNRIAMQ
jgi:hypothetical protein